MARSEEASAAGGPDGDEQGGPFLAQLADRVRTTRHRRATSRKALARHAQVSERYLAQLEAGKGNISVLLLRRIAHALGVPLAELIEDRAEAAADSALLASMLRRLTPAQAQEARNLLLGHFGTPAIESARDQRIALIGLRGGGKSTLGRMLAERLQCPFVELDARIAALSGMQLGQVFEMFGQETFRRTERRALEETLGLHPRFVLATGGSLVTEPATFELLLSSCLTVWVCAAPAQHMARVIEQGDLRPMADNARAMDDLISILKSREPLYRKADHILDTAGRSPEESLRQLVELVRTGNADGA
jgi:XRE family transcriptional regulator, aerobic/anaerobic benzoate catabolism transcriptional regulator